MTSKELLNLLNQAIARELQVSIQYMTQHIIWSGVHGFAVQEELKKIAIEEMSHAEKLGGRIYYLGEIPTVNPTTINVETNLKGMIEQDIKDEEGAIMLYKQIITQAYSELDNTTGFLASEILKEEEQHHDFFTTVNEGLTTTT